MCRSILKVTSTGTGRLKVYVVEIAESDTVLFTVRDVTH